MATGYLRFESISKIFPGVKALDDVSIELNEGTIHGIVGENGAGKSTLLNILNGVFGQSSGMIFINGKPVAFNSPSDAFLSGIAKIHQELHLVPEMTVSENLYLGHLPEKYGMLDKNKLLSDTLGQMDKIGEEVRPDAKVKHLSIAQRQMLEIAKALTRGAKIIAFDEPTSSLTASEAGKLFAMIKSLAAEGRIIIYVTHRLDEVFRICDSLTVMRDGRKVFTYGSLKGVPPEEIIEKMVGRSISDIYGYTPRKISGPVLEAEAVTGPGLSVPCGLTAASGEIVGIFGLVGAGRTELLRLIYGALPRQSGTIRIAGKQVEIRKPIDSIKSGMMYCPEDRKKEGIIPCRSVLENINLSARRNNMLAGVMLDDNWEKSNASAMVEKLAIKTPSLGQLIQNLSGGNQQKAILARWLSENIRILLLDEPTRGIDVGAKNEIYSLMYTLASQDIGIVMVSSDLPEILGVSDRIVVMVEGRIKGEFLRQQADSEKVMQMALPSGKRQ